MSLPRSELEALVAELVGEPERWRHLIRHSDDARVYEQIWDEDEVNAWVICWSVDQDTGFHDHDDSAAAIAVIEGHVREERLRIGRAASERVIGPGQSFYVPPTAIHRVLHAGTATAVTIHAYSPPLRRMGSYTVGPGGQLERAAQSYEEELRAEPAV